MSKLIIFALVIGTFALGSSAHAEVRPSFDLQSCTWHATHIVEVFQGMNRNGILTVNSSWKGDLRNGEVLKFSELRQFAPEDQRKVFVFDKPKFPPKRATHVSGLRMVLFLRKNANAGREPMQAPWQGTSWGPDIATSLAWLDGGEAFAYIQFTNPGDRVILPLDMTEKQFKDKVLRITETKEKLNQALEMKNTVRRARELKGLIQTGEPVCQRDAVEALGRCGEAALPVIQELLDRNPPMTLTADLIGAMGRIGGGEAGTKLVALLKEEFVFWQKRGPQLTGDWWHDWRLGQKEVYALRDRNTKFNAILGALADADYDECRPLVREIYAFVKAHPYLDTGGGYAIRQCRIILKEK